MLLRKILEVGSSCPKEMLFLETGTTHIRYIIMTRRLMFLHYILNEDKQYLIGRFLEAQERSPSKNDWVKTVKENMEELDICLGFEDIKELSHNQFNTFVKKSVEERTLSYLCNHTFLNNLCCTR